MSDSYDLSWKVTKLEWDDKTGGVISARWSIVVSDGTTTSVSPGTSKFNPDPKSKSYVQLKNLDEDTVLSWIKDSLINYKITESRAVERFLRERKISSTSSGLPWEKE